MKITIFNGALPEQSEQFDPYIESLEKLLSDRGVDTSILTLREMKLKRCIGCFGCWVKSPGNCQIRDEVDAICSAMVNSDVILHASPLCMGFVSPLIRMTTERMIPILMPYMFIADGQIRHTKRYSNYAKLGLLFAEESDTDQEDKEILQEIYTQISAEVHQELFFFAPTTTPVTEVANALISN